ncbi:MAG TPA: tetratricopeptide repeat protein, partial [Burkholderiales bacterium]|nr:tetratricopeptide repeat protein [Burkholderiales bacterium]
FDDALKQALIVQLRQSPYLSIVSDDRVRETLGFMGRSPDEAMTEPVAREICQRLNVKAMLSGSIASLGSQYVIALTAINCENGDRLATEQIQAARKEEVLETLGRAATTLRGKLGESLASVRQYDVAVAQATTPSLEALKAYTRGRRLIQSGQSEVALTHYERAVSLDPEFALAHVGISAAQTNLRDLPGTKAAAAKAYALRDRVTERERFSIDSQYFHAGLGDLDEAVRVYRRWAEVYPRDFTPRNNLGVVTGLLGRHEEALAHYQEAQRIAPGVPIILGNIANTLFILGRPAEAKQVATEVLAITSTQRQPRATLIRVACQEGDLSAAARHADEARQKHEELPLHAMYLCMASRGRLGAARKLEAELQAQSGLPSSHRVEHLGLFILTEWWLGDRARARSLVRQAANVVPDGHLPFFFPSALATTAEHARAREVLNALASEWPRATQLHSFEAPLAKAVLALNEQRPAQALEALREAVPVGAFEAEVSFYRGLAHMQTGAHREAVTAFREALQRQPYRQALWLGAGVPPVVQVHLAQALAASGDGTGAREVLKRFLAYSTGADADAPLLLEARRQLARLQ